MDEVFLPVVGHDGYEVSNCGNVRSYWRQVNRRGQRGGTMRVRVETPHLLKVWVEKRGYRTVTIARKMTPIGPLVLKAFVGPRPEEHECCHGPLRNGDDSLGNLSWGTRSKNRGADRLRDGTDQRGEKQGAAKLTRTQVMEIHRRANSGESQTDLAREFGVSQAHVWRIKNRKKWSWLFT